MRRKQRAEGLIPCRELSDDERGMLWDAVLTRMLLTGSGVFSACEAVGQEWGVHETVYVLGSDHATPGHLRIVREGQAARL